MSSERESNPRSDHLERTYPDAAAIRQWVLAEVAHLRETELGAELPAPDVTADAAAIDAYAAKLRHLTQVR